MKISNMALMIPVFLLATTAMATTYKMRSASSTFVVEDLGGRPMPASIIAQIKADNQKAKDRALQTAMKKLADQCLDPQWASQSQMDIISVTAVPASPTEVGTEYTLTVEAVCNSRN